MILKLSTISKTLLNQQKNLLTNCDCIINIVVSLQQSLARDKKLLMTMRMSNTNFSARLSDVNQFE